MKQAPLACVCKLYDRHRHAAGSRTDQRRILGEVAKSVSGDAGTSVPNAFPRKSGGAGTEQQRRAPSARNVLIRESASEQCFATEVRRGPTDRLAVTTDAFTDTIVHVHRSSSTSHDHQMFATHPDIKRNSRAQQVTDSESTDKG